MQVSFSFLPEYWPYFRDGVIYTLMLSFFTVVLAVLAVFVDPTTSGLCDSKQALTYEAPKKDQ